MADWKLSLTAPNGATGELVIDGLASEDDAAQRIAEFVAHVRQHDPEPLDLPEGTPAQIQPMRQAKSPQ